MNSTDIFESYIIRIYRRDENKTPCCLVGTVEDPSSRCAEAFHSGEELLKILDKKRQNQEYLKLSMCEETVPVPVKRMG